MTVTSLFAATQQMTVTLIQPTDESHTNGENDTSSMTMTSLFAVTQKMTVTPMVIEKHFHSVVCNDIIGDSDTFSPH